MPEMCEGYEKKTVLHSFREVVVKFVFRKLKLIYERRDWGNALKLKPQPCVAVLGLQWWSCCAASLQLMCYTVVIH